MNPGRILSAFAACEVDGLLIGGMNFFLRHRPVTTFDVDFWVANETANLERVVDALGRIGAEAEQAGGTWGPVPAEPAWLRRKPVHCLTSPMGAIDIFLYVNGLGSYEECRKRSVPVRTAEGALFRGLSDADMLVCQLALPEGSQRPSEFEALHARRDRQAGPLTWKQIEEFLTWAEAQLPPHQQRNRPRRHPSEADPLPSP